MYNMELVFETEIMIYLLPEEFNKFPGFDAPAAKKEITHTMSLKNAVKIPTAEDIKKMASVIEEEYSKNLMKHNMKVIKTKFCGFTSIEEI